MRAFNSPRTLAFILLIVCINCATPRNIREDEVVTDKKSVKVRDPNAEDGDIGGELGGSEEGIRRFDAVVEESERDAEEQDRGSSGVNKVSNKEDDGESEVKTGADVSHQRRSVKRKLDDGEADEASKHDEKEIGDDGEEGLKREGVDKTNGVIQVRQVPELIPVKIDHAGPYEPNFGGEEGARKSLGVVDDDEKIEDDERQGEVRNERSSEKKEEKGAEGGESIVQRWKQQAMTLQGQLKNRTFFQYLKEQASEVLPDIPKFTEIQLLEALKTISSRKSSGSEISYIKSMNTSMLNDKQLEIVKCAEGLVADTQRQTFSENMLDCVREMNILNCMRIFIWPIIAENVPERIMQNFPTLPIEVSLSDFLPNRQGEQTKIIRGVNQQRLLMPETVVANILKDALATGPHDENIPTQIDPVNFSKLLTPGQLDILKMAEKFLPESVRQEYASKMHSCVRRFEYFSCVKYFTWPMVKQHYSALPEFPDYQTWYPSTISVYPGYPIVPFPDLSDNNGQLPEVIEADGLIHRTPRPETIIFQLLKSTVEEQPRHQAATEIYAISDTSSITPEQLASIQMAQQLVPMSYRAEFIDKTTKCIQEYNYLFCTKYSTWPTLKQFQPRLPAFTDLESAFGNFFSKLPSLSSFFSGDLANKKNLTGLFGGLPWAGSWTGGSGSTGGSLSGGGLSQGSGSSSGGGGGTYFPGVGVQIPGFPGAGGSGGGGQIPSFPAVFPGVGGSTGGAQIPSFPGVGGSGGGAQIPGFPGIGGSGGGGQIPVFPGTGGSGVQIPGFPGASGSGGGAQIPGFPVTGGSGSGGQGGGGYFPGAGGSGSGGQGVGGPGGGVQNPGFPVVGGSGSGGQGGGAYLPGSGGSGSGSQSGGGPGSGSQSGGGSSTGGQGVGGSGGGALNPGFPLAGGSGSGGQGGGGYFPGSGGSGSGGQGIGSGVGTLNPGFPVAGGSGTGGQGGGGYFPGTGGSGNGGQIPNLPGIGGSGGIPGIGGSSGGNNIPNLSSGTISWPGIPGIKPPGTITWGGGGGSGGSSSTGLGSGSSGSTSGGPSASAVGSGSGQPSGGGSGVSSSGGAGQSGGGGSVVASSGGPGQSGGGGSGLPSSSGPGQSGGGGSSTSSSGGSEQAGGGDSSGSSSSESGQSGSSAIPGGGIISWGGSNGGQYLPGGGIPTILPGLGEQGSGGSGSADAGGSSGSGSTNAGSGNSGTYRPKPYTSAPPQGGDDVLELLLRGPAETLQQKSLEAKIIDILYNLRNTIPENPLTSIPMGSPRAALGQLNEDQMIILSLAKSIIPPPMRPDFASQTVGCLQGGSNFLGCTKNVIWPFLKFYIPNIPAFPDEKPQAMEKHSAELDFIPGRHYSLEPVSYTPFIKQHQLSQLFRQPIQILGRSPLRSEISANADDQPIISLTDPKFVPIYTDHPDTVALKILSAMADSVEQTTPRDYRSRVPAFITFYSTINSSLNDEQERILKTTEYLIPESSRQDFFNEMLACLIDNTFQTCARDNIWPALAKHYPRIPSFPNFQENSLQNNPTHSEDYRRISETDVKTGQHGDTVVTITDTRFVPIFSDHPEVIILKLLKDIQPSSLNQINTPSSSISKSPSYVSTFTKPQGDILVVAENLLPESIRDIFVMRMSECVRDNSFLDCTRDITWPTIGQFFPRLPSFPNFGSLPSLSEGKPQQPTLLPPVLDPTAPASEFPRISHSEHNQLQQLPETLEFKLEGILASVGLRATTHSGISYLNTEDPLTSALITDKQAKVIRMTECLIPEEARPMFIVKMMGCIRRSGFPICSQAVAWPTLRQFIPNIPEFPDISNFLPELPEVPDFSSVQDQLPELPSVSQFGQNLGQFIPQLQQPMKSEFPAQHGVLLPGYTASVGPAPVVPAFPGQPTDILVDISQDRVIFPEPDHQPLERKRREVINLIEDESILRTNEAQLNISESDLLQLLTNATESNAGESSETPDESFVESLNTTIKDSLTPQQLDILKMVEKLDVQNTRGIMGQVIRCVTGLSFIRCMGIFMWPFITSTVPSLLGIQLPFGRSDEDTEELFGVSAEDLEKELFVRKEELEHTLFDWYKSLTQEKFESTLGFIKFEGYGDGEIGIKFTSARSGRAKIKNHKNLPSILTIISDIMEDVLNTGKSSPKISKDKRRGRGLVFPLNKNSDRPVNDKNILNIFLQRLKANATDEDLQFGNRRVTPEDAYRAFELLFGPRLRARLVNNLGQLQENNIDLNDDNYGAQKEMSSQASQHLRVVPLELQEKKTNLFNEIHEEQDNTEENQFTNEDNSKSSLTIHLPKLNEEIISRKTSDSFTSLARHINKNNMLPMVPGIGFVITFVLQMALAHARAAASMATMLSNMAMGTAMFSLVRQAMFGQSNNPKIKYVYDNDVHGPGITWSHR